VGFGDEVKREAKTVVCSSGMVKLREKATLRREVFKSVRERGRIKEKELKRLVGYKS
jgi:hypothetical protein